MPMRATIHLGCGTCAALPAVSRSALPGLRRPDPTRSYGSEARLVDRMSEHRRYSTNGTRDRPRPHADRPDLAGYVDDARPAGRAGRPPRRPGSTSPHQPRCAVPPPAHRLPGPRLEGLLPVVGRRATALDGGATLRRARLPGQGLGESCPESDRPYGPGGKDHAARRQVLLSAAARPFAAGTSIYHATTATAASRSGPRSSPVRRICTRNAARREPALGGRRRHLVHRLGQVRRGLRRESRRGLTSRARATPRRCGRSAPSVVSLPWPG